MNVVFLDINGVLQPHTSFKRFDYMNDDTIKYLSSKYHTDYFKYGSYDVCAVYVDWDSSAVKRLKYILDSTNSSIIISSDWRDPNKSNKMVDLLKIQGLDSYYYTDNILLKDFNNLVRNRANEINDSLNKYDISNYIVLDDMVGLINYFPNNLVCTKNCIEDKDVESAIKILKKF